MLASINRNENGLMSREVTMKVDGLLPAPFEGAAQLASRLEAGGYDGVWTTETTNDPFLPLALASVSTQHVDLGTSIAVAFARNPMTLATTANDLQVLTEGRFILGLGSQIRSHIERRFSMTWSHPAARMKEFILAMQAIWTAWNERSKLDFQGEFYTHNLMTPFFDPGPNPFGRPRVLLAGVGDVMTTVAGEVADGFICHSFTTERYLREVTMPALRRGTALAGTDLASFEVTCPGFVATGRNEEEMVAAIAATRQQIAFYASTPAYRSVLDLHGWGDLQNTLTPLSKKGEWAEMAGLIDDEILEAFSVVGPPDDIGPELRRRYGDVTTRFTAHAPYRIDLDCWSQIVSDLQRT
jgi:probable F420-dependent oxidoreductase